MENLFLILAILLSVSNVMAKKKTIYVEPENAKIFVNGSEVGTGSYSINFKYSDDFVMLKFNAPGYIDRTVKLFKNNPQKTISYKLYEDEAFLNSVGGSDGVDIANRSFTIVVNSNMDKDVIWKRLMSIAINNFENVDVRDEAAGWIRTGWYQTTFLYQVVRTRLEIRQQFTGEGEIAYRIIISSEIADRDGYISDQSFIKYPRVLKKYEDVLGELQTTIGSNY